MCDTIVALGNTTADGAVLFAKNSDREPNEAHELILLPRTTHPKGSVVQCTYRQVPQISETFAVLLAKPFWIWGAEMGANEYGVVIGNEAVFTKIPYEKGPALTGMDLLRLALERAATARAALDVVVHLLETYGQGGNCGFTHPFFYHNSFLIADPEEAWVLETAGRQWAAEKVKDVRSISNALTIGREWDLASAGLVDTALEHGWCRSRDDFDFARCYSDFLYTRFSAAHSRQCRSTDLLQANQGRLTATHLMSYLRDHGPDGKPDWSPGSALCGAVICMHAGYGPVRINQSVGSLVSHLTAERQTHWVTGTSAPCTGIFKPVWIDGGLPEAVGLAPQGKYDPASLWWRHEVLHRAVLNDYPTRLALYGLDRSALEASFVTDWQEVKDCSAAERAAFTGRCFEAAGRAEAGWTDRVIRAPLSAGVPFLYRRAWQRFNREAALTEAG